MKAPFTEAMMGDLVKWNQWERNEQPNGKVRPELVTKTGTVK